MAQGHPRCDIAANWVGFGLFHVSHCHSLRWLWVLSFVSLMLTYVALHHFMCFTCTLGANCIVLYVSLLLIWVALHHPSCSTATNCCDSVSFQGFHICSLGVGPLHGMCPTTIHCVGSTSFQLSHCLLLSSFSLSQMSHCFLLCYFCVISGVYFLLIWMVLSCFKYKPINHSLGWICVVSCVSLPLTGMALFCPRCNTACFLEWLM